MIKMVGFARAAIVSEVGETSVDGLDVVLAGWGHDAGSRIIGDWDRAADMTVTDMQGEV